MVRGSHKVGMTAFYVVGLLFGRSRTRVAGGWPVRRAQPGESARVGRVPRWLATAREREAGMAACGRKRTGKSGARGSGDLPFVRTFSAGRVGRLGARPNRRRYEIAGTQRRVSRYGPLNVARG